MTNETGMSAHRLPALRDRVADGLSLLGVLVGPIALGLLLLVVLSGGASMPDQPGAEPGRAVNLAVWENRDSIQIDGPAQAARHLANATPAAFVGTGRSTREFWFSLIASRPPGVNQWLIDFPSRHAHSLSCWSQAEGSLLGSATRDGVTGRMLHYRAGFTLEPLAGRAEERLICRGRYEGPARISAAVWSAADLQEAQLSFHRTGSLIEAGIGVLAVFMLLTAMVTRVALYWVFFGWLALSMRMASLSAGTDFELFGQAIAAPYLVPMRHWTIGLYYAITVALFCLLFKDDLKQIRAGWLLFGLQLSALLFIPVCLVLSYQDMLPVVWVATTLSVLIALFYLGRILAHSHSRVAVWYAASMLITLIANMNEVVAASLDLRTLLGGLNSVTAAIASALLSSVAIAEHMRVDRIEKLRAQEGLRRAYEDSPIGLFTLDVSGFVQKMNLEFRSQLRAIRNLESTHFSKIFGADTWEQISALRGSVDRSSIEMQARAHAEGSPIDDDRWFAIKASSADGNAVEGSLQDITDKVNAMDRLQFLASHDPLTQCLNLRGLGLIFDEGTGNLPAALVYFDLDRFKLINDLYGHSAGDAVLKQVCERMKSRLLPEDVLARVGGDEFVVAFPTATIEEARQRCEAIVSLIASTPYMIDTQSFTLSISGGLVETIRFGAVTMKELVSGADTVCRLAKKRREEHLLVVEGDSTFFKYHKEQLELVGCLEQGETPPGLFLVMQPIMSLSAPYDSLNFEVLLRQRKPDGEIIPASILIDTAEAYGKIAIIDRWVVTTVIDWLETNIDKLPNTRFVGVNLSAGSLNDETFVEELFDLFSRHKEALSLMCLEITESVALTDIKVMQRLIRRAQALGAKVAIDDFGAGYSSFGYLKGLSADALKLDGSLIKDAPRNPAGMVIIEAIAGLARSLGMRSVGEFAEDLPTIQAIADAGINYAQGYGVSKPVEAERILQARSCVDLIEDPEVLKFVQQIRAQNETADSQSPQIRLSLH